MNRFNRALTFLGVALALIPGLQAQDQMAYSQLAVPNSPAYEQAAEKLRMAPPHQYDFAKAMMVDVMRVMAEDAGISFFGLPEGATGADRLVTFSINASPFTALETLAKANGISLIFENGIWYIRPADDSELVGRIYKINYNAQELVTKNSQSGGSLGGGSGVSGSGAGASSIGLDLQGAPDFFVTEPSRLLEDIRGILDLQTTGRNATFAPTGSVDTLGQLALGGLQAQPDIFVRTRDGAGGNEASSGDASNQAKVIWNSDSNSLYVVATRQQHQWVEGYLAAADQPQPLVAVEVKFLEINKDPQRELGIDWTGALSGGWGATLEGVDGSISSELDLDRIGDYVLPTAILSYDDVNVRLRALFDDRRNRTVSYPRMITLDNREVSFRSVINQPVLSTSASTSLGAGATQTNSVEYIPIGTVINILPKRMNDGKVLLNVSITVSDIIGTEVINGNPFPIASSRVYTAPITVDSGYTVAISGLDAAEDDQGDTGVPVLGRIPVLGYAFKYRGESRNRQHLMMLITPTLMNPNQPGVPERPRIRNPWGSQLPAFDPFADDQLPYDEQTRSEKRETRKEMKNAAPRPLVGPEGGRAPYFSAVPPSEAPVIAEVQPQVAPQPEVTPVSPPAPEELSPPRPLFARSAESGQEKKGPLARIFGRKKSEKIETGPVDQESGAFGPGVPAWETTSAPMGSGVEEAEVIPMPEPGAAMASASEGGRKKEVSKSSGKLRWDGTRLAGGTSAVPGAVSQLEKNLESASLSGDSEKVAQVRSDTSRLLDYVNELRNNGEVPVNGELSDEWWTLIKLKTQANAITRETSPALVDGMVDP